MPITTAPAPTATTAESKPGVSATPISAPTAKKKSLVIDVQYLNTINSKNSKKLQTLVLDAVERNVLLIQNMEILKVPLFSSRFCVPFLWREIYF
jgi:hypothetical protein